MSIILEGPDAIGKTTMAKLLQQVLGWKIIHYGPEMAGATHDEYLSHASHHGRHVIVDRFHVSDFIYGRHLDRSSPLNAPQHVELLSQALFNVGWETKIFCALPEAYDIMIAKAVTQRDELYSLNDCVAINKLYVANIHHLGASYTSPVSADYNQININAAVQLATAHLYAMYNTKGAAQ